MTHVYKEKFIYTFQSKTTEIEAAEKNYENQFKRTFLSFLWNRIARLYPLVFFSLTIVIVIKLGDVGWEIVFEYFLISNWIHIDGFTLQNGVLWSLDVEFILYLLFPFFLWINHRFDKRKNAVKLLAASSLVCPIILLIGSFICYLFFDFFPSDDFLIYRSHALGDIFNMFRGLQAFYAGMCCYQVYELHREHKSMFDFLSLGALILNLVIAIFVPSISLYMYGWFLFIFFLVKSNSFMKFIFEMKIFLFFGEISFSIYLLHGPIILYLNDYITSLYSYELNAKVKLLIFSGYFSFIIIYSYLIYTYYEMPTRDYLKKVWISIEKRNFEKKLLAEAPTEKKEDS